MPATAGAPTAVSHQVNGYLALLVNKYLKNATVKMAASIATASYYHRGTHLLQFLLKALLVCRFWCSKATHTQVIS